MQSNLYVSLSGQLALQRRLDTIANNLANVSTAGFRSEEVKFSSLISRTGAEPVAFATEGETYLSRTPGALVKTDNPLDVAVQGDAWLAINTPAGTVYTRDGRMKILPTGELVTLNNYPVLDVGQAPLVLDPRGGAVTPGRKSPIRPAVASDMPRICTGPGLSPRTTPHPVIVNCTAPNRSSAPVPVSSVT